MKKLFKLGNEIFPLIFVFFTILFFASCGSNSAGGGATGGGGGDNGGGGSPASVNISANPAWYNGTLTFTYSTANTISLKKENGEVLTLGSGTVVVNNVTADYVLKLVAVGTDGKTVNITPYTGTVYDDATTRLCKIEGTNILYTVIANTIDDNPVVYKDTLEFRVDHSAIRYNAPETPGLGTWQLTGNIMKMFHASLNFEFKSQTSFRVWYINGGNQVVSTTYAK